jgi:hypothetical protein
MVSVLFCTDSSFLTGARLMVNLRMPFLSAFSFTGITFLNAAEVMLMFWECTCLPSSVIVQLHIFAVALVGFGQYLYFKIVPQESGFVIIYIADEQIAAGNGIAQGNGINIGFNVARFVLRIGAQVVQTIGSQYQRAYVTVHKTLVQLVQGV